MKRDTWGCINYLEDKTFKIKTKSINWIKKNTTPECGIKTARTIKLHIILHEIGHYACEHYRHFLNQKPDMEEEFVLQTEYEAWLYASQCLKNPLSILKTIAYTTENIDLLMILEAKLNPEDKEGEEFNWWED